MSGSSIGNNDFLPFAAGANADVETQASYAADPQVSTGFVTGLASTTQVNKVLRQSSAISAMIGNFIALKSFNANDDANATELVEAFINALDAQIEQQQTNPITAATGVVNGTQDAWVSLPTPIGVITFQFGIISVPQTGTGPYTFRFLKPFTQNVFAVMGSFGAARTPPLSNTATTLGFQSTNNLSTFSVQSTVASGGDADAANYLGIGI